VSHIELDAIDRGSVERARALRDRAETGTDLEYWERLGKALAAVGILLRVIDGEARS